MRSALVILGLVLAAAAGALLLGSGPDAPPDGPDAGEERPEGPSAPATSASSWGGGRNSGGSVVNSTGDTTGLRTEDLDDSQEGRPGPVLVVLDQPGGEPMPGVTVRWLERGEANDPDTNHRAEVVEARGRRGTTDDEGRVQLPPPESLLLVVASSEGRFGYRSIRARRYRDVETLPLVADETLTVEVGNRHGEGMPDAPVAILQQRERGWRRALNLRTDENGVVQVRHFQLHTPSQRRVGRRFQAALRVPAQQPAVAEFGSPPPDRIRLLMPPVGTLITEILGPGSEPFTIPARVSIEPVRGEKKAPPTGWQDVGAEWKDQGESQVRFDYVGLGLQLTATTTPRDNDLAWESAPFPGPITEGEVVTVKVPPPDWMGVLTGSVRTGEGMPWRESMVNLMLTSAEGRLEGEQVTTSKNATFQLPFKLRGKRTPPFELEARASIQDVPVGAVVYVPAPSTTSVDVGEIVLEPLPVLALGVVKDDTGQVIPEARVQLMRLRIRQSKDGPQERWVAESDVRDRTDEAGRFQLRAVRATGRFLLEARARGHRTARSQEFTPGSRINLELLRTASLSGVATLPRWVPQQAVRVELLQDGRPKRGWHRIGGGRLRFRFDGLDPGAYDFRLLVTGFDEPLYEQRALWLEPGANELAPPLPDLSNVIFRYRIRAIDALGATLRDPGSPLVAHVTRVDGAREAVGFPWRNGRVEVISASPVLEVTWLGSGVRPQSQTLGPGESALTFERLQPVELTVGGARAAAGDGRTVRVSMVLKSDTGLPQGMRATDQSRGNSRNYSRAQLGKSGGAWLRANDMVRVPLMNDGTYDVVLRLYPKEGETKRTRPQAVKIGTVEVKLRSDRSAKAAVQVDAKRVQNALQKLLGQK